MIGLAGAHRTGKTSLARASARALKLPFVEVGPGAVFSGMGIDPAEPMDIQTRLLVQSVVLKEAMEKWAGYKDGFLSDRTPIDMLAYTLADIQGTTLDAVGEALLANYTTACIRATNHYFGLVMLIQPGIPIRHEKGKAAPSRGYMEHLNTIMAGLLARRDLQSDVAFLRRETLDMNTRIECVVHSYKRIIKEGLQQRSEVAALH